MSKREVFTFVVRDTPTPGPDDELAVRGAPTEVLDNIWKMAGPWRITIKQLTPATTTFDKEAARKLVASLQAYIDAPEE